MVTVSWASSSVLVASWLSWRARCSSCRCLAEGLAAEAEEDMVLVVLLVARGSDSVEMLVMAMGWLGFRADSGSKPGQLGLGDSRRTRRAELNPTWARQTRSAVQPQRERACSMTPTISESDSSKSDSDGPPSPALETTPLVAAKARPAVGQPRRQSSGWSRQLRANNILGKLIPALILFLAIKGYNLVVFQTGSRPTFLTASNQPQLRARR